MVFGRCDTPSFSPPFPVAPAFIHSNNKKPMK